MENFNKSQWIEFARIMEDMYEHYLMLSNETHNKEEFTVLVDTAEYYHNMQIKCLNNAKECSFS